MKIFRFLLFTLFIGFGNQTIGQSVSITPKGNTSSSFSLSTTLDISQTDTPTVSQLIYNTNTNITGVDANGAGYYFWNGSNWQSLDANIPPNTIVFSETHPNQNLINAGFSMIGTTQVNTPATDVWLNVDTTNTLSKGVNAQAFFYNSKFFIWGGYNINSQVYYGKFYDPSSDKWTNINSSNAPTVSTTPKALKDVVLYTNDDINQSRIFKPNTNSWDAISILNAPILSSPNWRELPSNLNSNYIFYWNNSQCKIFDALTNSWINTSMNNIPTQSSIKVMMGNRVLVSGNDFQLGSVYDIDTDIWTTLAPSPNQSFNQLSNIYWNDSLLIVAHTNLNNQTIDFSLYNPDTNSWVSTWGNIQNVSGSCCSNMTYLGKFENKDIFIREQDFFIHNNDNNLWQKISIPNDDWLKPIHYSNYIKLCGSKIILFGTNRFLGGIPPIIDGIMYDLNFDVWKYIPPVFGRNTTNSINCCNKDYLFSFGGNIVSTAYYSNKTGIMFLSNSNQNTVKNLYLYRKSN